MDFTGPILVGTDLQPGSDEALRQGLTLARTTGAPLVVCHVLPDLSQVRVLFPQDAGPNPLVLAELRQRAVASVVSRVLEVTGSAIEDELVQVEFGSPHGGLHQAAEDLKASVVVVGPGPTGPRMTHQAPWAVLVARPSTTAGCVLGATDLSDPALPAVEASVAEARRRDVPLRLIHAIPLDFGVAGLIPGPPAVPIDQNAIREVLDRAVARLTASLDAFGADGDCLVARGPAAPSIVEAARQHGAALVVVGTRGRTGFSRLVLGSVAEEVMRSAACSVLAVPLFIGSPPDDAAESRPA